MSGAIRAVPHSGRRQGSAALPVATRVAELDWTAISRGLDDFGSSLTGHVLGPSECKGIAELYGDDRRFRSTIEMARYRFGQGQYRYFDQPLPKLVAELRAAFWPHLLPIARAWAGRLGQPPHGRTGPATGPSKSPRPGRPGLRRPWPPTGPGAGTAWHR